MIGTMMTACTPIGRATDLRSSAERPISAVEIKPGPLDIDEFSEVK